MDFLTKNGYSDTLDRLVVESGLKSRWLLADNIDLSFILIEFEHFYEMKYGRQVRIVRPEEEEQQTQTKRKSNPLPPLPAGVSSMPSALPAHYRAMHPGSSSSNSDDMSYASAGSVNGTTSLTDREPDRDKRDNLKADRKVLSRSAKNSRESSNHHASTAALHPSTTTTTTNNNNNGAPGSQAPAGTPSSEHKKDKRERESSSSTSKTSKDGERDKKSSSLEFGIQGTSHVPPSSANSKSASSSSNNNNNSSSSSSSSSSHANNNMLSTANSSPSASPVSSSPFLTSSNQSPDAPESHTSYLETRILKPMPFYQDAQFRELAHVITRDIYSDNPNVHWNDIVELEDAKQLLKEAVVMPLKFPQFFTGLLSPWKGVLLYGPPGTGKTMLARAVATECHTTFFNISASSIVSKYRGDSEKLVRVLFELARYHAPSTIFIDEIDAIMSRRDSNAEHEGSRRMKTELLVQMDGLSKSNDLVFVLAASNLPWDLDIALLRRLEKRILVPLPNEQARKAMIRAHLPALPRGQVFQNNNERALDVDYDALAKCTEGYSGSDIGLLCKEAAMRPVRRLMKKLMTLESEDAEVDSEVLLDAVTMPDVKAALACTRPSAASKFINKYAEWHAEYGASIHDVTFDNAQA